MPTRTLVTTPAHRLPAIHTTLRIRGTIRRTIRPMSLQA
jgi:hypothetical protein